MQIRYLEAMQAMAKSANSKVIFLPAANQTMPTPAQFDASLDKGESSKGGNTFSDFNDGGFNQAINARVIENI
jgi:hypothetical protein